MLQEQSDLSLIIAQIVQKLKGSSLYAQLERQAWASLQRPEIKLESLKEDIKEFFKTSGWEKKLQNAVYSELTVFPLPSHPAAPPEHLKEPLVYMRKAQVGYRSFLIICFHARLYNAERKIIIAVRIIYYPLYEKLGKNC
uniref:TBC1 domain family member 19 n=1 Tax=Rousettus aegyptiacus TaxID=9407 RepID=A0A7J8EAV9_ROUAE|nr:TBC1 domain family member 19 [Rousettus aegyptiacus]